MFSLILDTKQQTLIVDDYDPMPVSGNTGSKNTVTFSGSPAPKDKDAAEFASLNRITGEASVRLKVGGRLLMIHGVCQPAQKLF
jgi:hypothetical protein